MNQYSFLAKAYDALNFGCDYARLADFLTEEIRANEAIKSSLVLDLACGTGALALLLRERGFDMTGVDLSQEMLSVATSECAKRGINDILWLCQDMTDFELYGTVDACVCSLDSLNYLTSLSKVKRCLELVHNYLIPDGVFIFDLNTPYRFKEIYGSRDYVLENDGTHENFQEKCLAFFKELLTIKENA